MKILITGASGFIGEKVLDSFIGVGDLVVTDANNIQTEHKSIHVEKGKIGDKDFINWICKKYIPQIVIHCAGIAHQKIGGKNFNEYFRTNSYATEQIAKKAILHNPDVHFIFLSSISVYGEHLHDKSVSESTLCNPSSDYAKSKLYAEKRLKKLYDSGCLKRLDILRLSPVYDSEWSLNLDRRVFIPKKTAYIRFGKGKQMMSAVSRKNVVGFIEFLLQNSESFGERYCNVYNVCDQHPYSFNTIIDTFKQSPYHPDRGVFTVPLPLVWVLTRLAGLMLINKRQWLHSCYDKLANDLVFDNSRMLATGFKPKQSLEAVFNPQVKKIPSG